MALKRRAMVDVIVDGERAVFVAFAKRKGGFLVSPEDVALIESHNWFYHSGYVARREFHGAPWIPLHRELMGFPEGMEVDHRNVNKLDNRRSNLCCATRSENARNMPRLSKQTPYKGIFGTPRAGGNTAWRACIRLPGGKKVQGGYFPTQEEAAKDYNRLAETHFGAFALVNKL